MNRRDIAIDHLLPGYQRAIERRRAARLEAARAPAVTPLDIRPFPVLTAARVAGAIAFAGARAR